MPMIFLIFQILTNHKHKRQAILIFRKYCPIIFKKFKKYMP